MVLLSTVHVGEIEVSHALELQNLSDNHEVSECDKAYELNKEYFLIEIFVQCFVIIYTFNLGWVIFEFVLILISFFIPTQFLFISKKTI